MKVIQLYTGCLAEAAYYIESEGEVAIIDPLREVAPYIQMAKDAGSKIKYVLETHFHADFVSGHIDLAKKTGAQIVYGPTATPGFDAFVAKDEQVLTLGNITIKVLHTPGHTLESSCFLLIDEHGKEHALFSGDTLFIGDVGRPDLAVKTDLTQEDLAGYLFDSIRNKIMPLPNEVIIYPGHGAGSACGKKMSKETSDTLGNQKLFNYALNPDLTKEQFTEQVLDGLVTPPQYFPKNAVMNKQGYESIDQILNRGAVGLDAKHFMDMVKRQNALLLDTRPEKEFAQSFIPGSLWIGVDNSFAPWVGALIEDLHRPIVFVAQPGKEEEVVTRLARVGYDHSIGYLEGGIEAWKSAGYLTDIMPCIGPDEFVQKHGTDILHVLDVRKSSEFMSQHMVGVESIPLSLIYEKIEKLNNNYKYYVYCQGGYRSMIACSILKAEDFEVINVEGGMNEIKKTCSKLTEYEEPATLL